jgi:hypothetical protein
VARLTHAWRIAAGGGGLPHCTMGVSLSLGSGLPHCASGLSQLESRFGLPPSIAGRFAPMHRGPLPVS